jgi:hypothetical protein
MPFDRIIPKDFAPITMLFTKNGNEYYDCYKKFLCTDCGTFDWLKATKNGILAPPKLPLKMPDLHLTSFLCAYVVSDKMREVMNLIDGCNAEFYPIPNYRGYSIMLPKNIIFPPKVLPMRENPKVCRTEDPNLAVRTSVFCTDRPLCKKCGQYGNIFVQENLFFVPDNINFAGIFLGMNDMILIASRYVSEQLRKAKLTGMVIEKNAFANPKK